MLTAFSNQRNHCYAWETERSEAPFFCKECLQEVILRKGTVRAHHFAHKPPVSYQYGLGESDVHHSAKKSIFESLKSNSNCTYCELEYKINNAIPDIYAIINNIKVDIEVQRSNITINDIYNKMLARTKENLSVIWIIPSMKQLKFFTNDNPNIARIPKWMEYIHAIYYGRIYVWSGNGDLVIPIHLSKVTRYIPADEIYNSDGEYISIGGYEKILKDRKLLLYAPNGAIKLSQLFSTKLRDIFVTKNYSIPKCLIWLDNLKKWW